MKNWCRYIAMALLLLATPVVTGCSISSPLAAATPKVTPTTAYPTPSLSTDPTPSLCAYSTPSPCAYPTPSPFLPVLPTPEETPYTEEGEYSDYSYLPMSVPEINDADMETFHPELLQDYLAQISYHENEIVKAALKDGVLYLTVVDHRYFWDVNEAYTYLKDEFGLSDKKFLSLPLFSGCVIKDGEVFLSKEDYIKYTEDFGNDFYDDFWYIFVGEVTLDPVPVSEDATIFLLNNDTCEYNEMSAEEFTNYVLNGRTESDFKADHIFLYDITFQYSDGMITGLRENDEENY